MIKSFKIEMDATDYTFNIVTDDQSDYFQILNQLNSLVQWAPAQPIETHMVPAYELLVTENENVPIYNFYTRDKYTDFSCPVCGEKFIIEPAECEHICELPCDCGHTYQLQVSAGMYDEATGIFEFNAPAHEIEEESEDETI